MRVGIIGCGLVSEKHIPYLGKIKGIDIMGVCDLDEVKANECATRFGINNAFSDVSKMLTDANPEAVHILTPPHTHKDLAIQSMQAGAHVLVEKPMALNLEEAEEMISAAKQHGVFLGVCHNFLFEPIVVTAKALTASGKLGRILSIEIYWRIFRAGPIDRYQKSNWMHRLPGGIFHEVAAHPLYLQMEFLKGLKVVSVIGKKYDNSLPGKFDELQVLFDSSTAMTTLNISANARPRQVFMRIYGSKMSLHLDLTTNSMLKIRKIGTGKASTALVNIDQSIQLLLKTINSSLQYIRGRFFLGHEKLIENFYKSIKDGRPPYVTAEDGKSVVAILNQIWKELK
ncbi:MAG: Gfo/Idh/MocA family protein [Planctomycetota bacterium]|jgi:predicted dehydrogenase